MPLLRRRPFVKQKLPSDLTLDEEVFHCTLTNELFRDYEKFFERIILCNSLVWTCAITGRPGLTYQEALESEGRARKQLASFPEHLQKVVLYLATRTHRSRLTDINDDVFVFVKDRFFINEVVDALVDGQRKVCRVIKVISLDAEKKKNAALETDDSDDDVICLDDPVPGQKATPTKQKVKDEKREKPCSVEPLQYQYVLQELKKPNIYVLQPVQLSRKKGLLTRDKCKLYLKQHCDPSQDGIWRVKAKYAKKFKLSEVTFDDFCGGPAPSFAVSNAKRKPSSTPLGPCTSLVDLTEEDSLIRKAKKEHKERREKKLKKTEKKIATLEDELSQARMNAQEREILREKLRVERLTRKEELKQRLDEEKQRRKAEKAKEREQKREERLQREATLREWSRPRDDMECDDLKDLPVPIRIEGLIATEQFGDVVMVLEFLQCFSSLLEVKDTFPHGISFEELAKALKETTVNGLFNDLMYFLLTSIFNMQEQEENEEEQDLSSEDTNMKIEGFGDYKNISYDELVKQATVASQWPQANYGTSLRNLPLDGFTLSEVLRLHFLSSGAKATPSNIKFHYQQRGGYTPLDDAGLEFRQIEAAILKSLAQKSVFEMSVEEKLKVLQALVQQLLTYVSVRDVIEDSHEKLRQLRNELRQYQWAGQRRDRDEANFWYKKRVEEKLKEVGKKTDNKGENVETEKTDKPGVIDLTDTTNADHKSDNTKPVDNKPKAERKSERQKAAAEKSLGYEDLLTENIDWENISEEERRSMKERFMKHERQLSEAIDELQYSNAISPIGRDRTYRRYWVFRCLSGVFVEDDEQNISDDVLQPVTQKKATNPLCKTSSLSPGIPAEDRSTNSDKENESFEAGRSVWGSGNVDKALSLSTNNNDDDGEVTVKTDSMLEDEKLVVSSVSVHEQIKNRNSMRWSFYSNEAEINRLIESLNPRGYREGALKLALLEQKERVTKSLQDCPVGVLNPALISAGDKKVKQSNSKSSRNKATSAAAFATTSPEEALELNLREMLLDIEERIYIGSLGAIKVKDRAIWRDAIERGQYNPQCDDLPSGGRNTSHCSDELSGSTDGDADGSLSVALAAELARALLQIQQSIESRYLQLPLGTAEDKKVKRKGGRNKEKEEEKDEDGETSSKPNMAVLDRWQASLLKSKSLSQVFLHLSILEKSVMWSKSALHARCRICRRKGDGEHMLLCDDCDRGHHMYCLKPPVLKVPHGDWYCPECRPKEVVRTPRKHRRSFYDEDSETEVQDQVVAVSSEDSDIEDQSTEEEEDEEEEQEEAEESDEGEEAGTEEETEEEEEEQKPAKIKFNKGRWKPSTAVTISGTSTPLSSHPNSRSSSRAATPKETIEGRVRGSSRAATKTRSLGTGDASPAAPTSRSKPANPAKRTRHSIETERPSKVSKRNSQQKGEQTRHSLEPKKSTRTSQGAKRKSTSDNMTQAPVNKQQKTLAVTTATMTKCRGSDRRLLVMKQCEDLMQELTDRNESWPFLKPVTRRDAPDYFDIVKMPMDFQRMRNKINKFEYTDPAEMVDDIRRIFYNCQQYNMPTAPEYQAGQKMSRYFEKRLRELTIDQYLAKAAGKSSPGKSPAQSQKAGGKRK